MIVATRSDSHGPPAWREQQGAGFHHRMRVAVHGTRRESRDSDGGGDAKRRRVMLSIVIGTYNRRDQIERAIRSIVDGTRIPHHIFVTDAGSTDGTVEYLDSLRSETITPLLVGAKLGQARAYNDVFAQVRTPYVCWLSDDNEIVPGGLDNAVEILRKEPRIGMVGLKVRDIVGPFVEAPYIGGVSAFGILNVNQGVLPMSVLREVGFFSEAFRDYGIDADLTARVLLAGYDVVYTRDIAIHHHRNWETDSASPEYARMQERQRAYHELYRTTYAERLGRPPTLMARRALWRLLHRGLKIRLDSHQRVAGLLARDWHNILASRSISLAGEMLHRDAPYYLRQRALARAPAALGERP